MKNVLKVSKEIKEHNLKSRHWVPVGMTVQNHT